MNIWYISKYAVTPKFGQATRQYFLSKYFVKEGNYVKLISSQSAALKNYKKQSSFFLEYQTNGINHVLLSGKNINLGFSIRRIVSWLFFEIRLLRYSFAYKGQKPDVIIVSSLSLLTFISGVILKKKYKSKLILEVRDIWPLSLIEIANLSKYNPFVLFLSLIEKFGYRNADGIVGTMPKLEEHVYNVIGKKIKFMCIPMGYDEEYILDTPKEIKSKYSLPENKFIVCYAGTIGKVNLVDQILEAAKILRFNDRIHFAILGDGPLKSKYIEKYKSLNNVFFYDSLPKNEVNLFLQKCNLLLHPVSDLSIYKYGISPNKWIDYMLSSKPILVSYAGYRSIINDADCGFFVEPDNSKVLSDKILEISLLEDEKLQKIGQNGRVYVEKYHNYTWLSKQYLDFIKST
jgi:glycosyltransferase involved in cell wall biosynthesis